MCLFPWTLRESLKPPWMVSKKGKGPIVNTCIYIWMSLVHIEGYSLFLSNTKILSKSSDPFPLTGWVSGNRSELSLKCPFVYMSVSNFFYWTEILFKEICSPVLNVFVEILIWVRRDGIDSESFKWSNMMNLTRWFRCRNANLNIQEIGPKVFRFHRGWWKSDTREPFFGRWYMTMLV